jgi:alpha-galactosidase
MTGIHVLRSADVAAGVEVVVDTTTGVPTIRHWGAPLAARDLDSMTAAAVLPIVAGAGDVAAPLSVVPEHGAGFTGRPGLAGHRAGGRAWAPRLQPETIVDIVDGIEVVAVDPVAGLRLTTRIRLDHVLAVWIEIENAGDGRYHLDGLTVTLPVPDRAAQLLTVGGRWAGEMQVERRPWPTGAHLTENRRGRTSHHAPPYLAATTTGAGEWHGEVWAAHLAWSGNHVVVADRLDDGRRMLQLGELLHPGEIVLQPGERYRTPTVVGSYSADGLTPASWAFHREVRASPARPRRPRPVLLNTWEAVYFDHDLAGLLALADRAAAVGVERFVLDDGWFSSRRDDTSGLGDWWVSTEAHPGGLAPLVDHVTSLGMEFGIWVEPEMVSPDSELYRAHPDWALATDGYEPVTARNQLVLDLTRPDAYEHVAGQLHALLDGHAISFVKWDMNRDHVQGSGVTGAAGTHAQTLAVYRLLDELRAAHPTVEFESCASGGGRVDLEILRRTERVWTSDCNDPIDRQRIQHGTSLLVPPEVMGAHIGPARAHTTGRVSGIAMRVATALFGHLGLELDLRRLDEGELAEVAASIELHRRFRTLVHSGDAVRFDTEPPYLAHGVYAADRSQALVSWAVLDSPTSLTPPMWCLPGLRPGAEYHVRHVPLPGERWGTARSQPDWLLTGVTLSGAALAVHGIRPPVLLPGTAVVVELVADEGARQ